MLMSGMGNMVRLGMVRRSVASCSLVRVMGFGEARPAALLSGLARYGFDVAVRQGDVGFGEAEWGLLGRGKVGALWYGLVLMGKALSGQVWFSLALLGMGF